MYDLHQCFHKTYHAQFAAKANPLNSTRFPNRKGEKNPCHELNAPRIKSTVL